jgi:hypothetical protein
MKGADVLVRWNAHSFGLTGWGWVVVFIFVLALWNTGDRKK